MSDDRLRAQRRLDLGLALAGEGDYAAAVEALQAACELAPDWVEAHFALAENLEKLPECRLQAETAYTTCLSLDPTDRMGARIRLTLLGAAPTPDRLPAAYVEALFDQEARRFDAKMREKLNYQGPEAIAEAVSIILPQLTHPARVLDLGCGTGLIAPSLRLAAGRLDGLDLSSGMLVQAVATGLYDSVRQGDLLKDAWLIDEHPYDLIAAGDVLNYIGDLAPVFQSASAALSPGGFFVFTVEAGEDTQIELGEGHRYRHGDTRLRPWIAAALLDLISLERRVLRQEKRQPVYGLIGIARKPVLSIDMGLPVPHFDQKTV
ncbi:MAG TPA: methyltransferase type 11 [Rhodospirillaceae bacterium]|nr:methyltransferase type 11 [Rhodospirillaceae bacterium]MAX62636.1 methyltransferase type 11 [Rhodospirillaceae bacterium]MBB57036.1 methyltransferase type 11 [Rhodospirillaceae bacterium]HAE03880.1 methyltransferase type 11 [Rhodospirillaceae bacterium]|tara:strand:- start:41878 stop:42837 length:960 start_codon:yes stop_codon:yes gene_type:complete